MHTLLGISSRIRHDESGNGVVINSNATGYRIMVHDHGVKILKFDAPLTIIEAMEPDGNGVSLFDVEPSNIPFKNQHQPFVGEKVSAAA